MTEDSTTIIRAKDVMQKGIVTIDGMATARDAAAKMRTEKISYLLVEKRHENTSH